VACERSAGATCFAPAACSPLLGLVGGRTGSALARPAEVGGAPPPRPGIYESIGVKPVINCRGVNTYISGSTTLPEVKRAMDEAGRQFVDMNELANGVIVRPPKTN
jgi:hypothetical protein